MSKFLAQQRHRGTQQGVHTVTGSTPYKIPQIGTRINFNTHLSLSLSTTSKIHVYTYSACVRACVTRYTTFLILTGTVSCSVLWFCGFNTPTSAPTFSPYSFAFMTSMNSSNEISPSPSLSNFNIIFFAKLSPPNACVISSMFNDFD